VRIGHMNVHGRRHVAHCSYSGFRLKVTACSARAH
jgi:hypothetical protein